MSVKPRNLLIYMKYSGVNYHGWQIQQNAESIQGVFQRALYKVLGCSVDVKGCSRTDTGVHANMYCVSFVTVCSIPCDRVVWAMNRFLPKDIVVYKCCEVNEDFHARYSCSGKEYVYKILNAKIRDPFMDGYVFHYWYNLDVEKLHKAAQAYVGEHDFTSFCTLDRRHKGDFKRIVNNFSVDKEGEIVQMRVSANGFLYNMVRIMVGTLLQVQRDRIKAEDLPSIIKAKDRSKAGPTAPACGLYLNKVFYN